MPRPVSHLILPGMILDIMDIKRAYPDSPTPGSPHREFITCVEMTSYSGIIEVKMPFKEFKERFEIALGVNDVKNN